MKLDLCAKGVHMTDKLQSFIDRKLRYALGRFSRRVSRVHVQLTDINGPRGGEDILCRIRANLDHAGVVTINETRGDPFAAVAGASERTRRQVSRHLARSQANRRGR